MTADWLELEIMEAETRITQTIALIWMIRARGDDASQTEQLLCRMNDTLAGLYAHRRERGSDQLEIASRGGEGDTPDRMADRCDLRAMRTRSLHGAADG